ncbi:hypothetical protein [Thiocystis violacea]|uniref:hypothetical protein n=1 Tax=Thiocystis violacea TaxID=13725 RepID=UPI0031F8EEA9
MFRLELPPLRRRKEDLEELLPVLIHEFNLRSGHRVETIPPSVWSRLGAYDWPGNVRELRNLVERCVLLADGPVFPERWLNLGEAAAPPGTDPPGAVADGERICLPLDGSLSLEAMERHVLAAFLKRNADNVCLTARVLSTTREKLRYRVRKYGLKTSD